ncbi:TIGR03757 family integrating conjugative element protein [uncultured Pseudoteredinibacter sp.]|uniref:TIGR03757 family integrating conjugative element protein n=1 Tax=uncultured Pseudoteredinibacter sp. TaxID=1641701 RepID=UPI002621A6B8|nr:TIGR03757 family integrating conjugative element protein [uncultured Pseudoteredinibacter sp.]
MVKLYLHHFVTTIGLAMFSCSSIAQDQLTLLTGDVANQNLQHAESDRFILSIHVLGAAERWAQQYSANLPKEAESAKKHFLEIWQSKREEIQDEIKSAYQPLLYSISKNINRYPAVVINDRYVIYGVEDVNKAYAIYLKWVEKQTEASQ